MSRIVALLALIAITSTEAFVPSSSAALRLASSAHSVSRTDDACMFGGSKKAKPKKGAKTEPAARPNPLERAFKATFSEENWLYQAVTTLQKLPQGRSDRLTKGK